LIEVGERDEAMMVLESGAENVGGNQEMLALLGRMYIEQEDYCAGFGLFCRIS
jgi:hypothetical protein